MELGIGATSARAKVEPTRSTWSSFLQCSATGEPNNPRDTLARQSSRSDAVLSSAREFLLRLAWRSNLVSSQRGIFLCEIGRDEPFVGLSAWIFHADPAPHLPGELRTKLRKEEKKKVDNLHNVALLNCSCGMSFTTLPCVLESEALECRRLVQ